MTTSKPQIGFCLPSNRSSNVPFGELHSFLQALTRDAEELGYHSAWVWDHMLPAPRFYNSAWFEPFATMAAAAGTSLRLGTGILIAPTRNPVLAAQAVSTVQHMTGTPLLLGVGTGWNDKEFEAAQVRKGDRGRLTDEFLDVLLMMFEGGGSFSGRHFSFDDVDPGDLGPSPEVWIAGGSMIKHEKSLEKPVMAEAVARRILRHGRWVVRPTASPDMVAEDRALLGEWAAKWGAGSADAVAASHINVMHLVETDDSAKARETQLPYFYNMMSHERGMDYFEQAYMTGSIDDIRARVAAWQDSGMEHLVFYPLGEFTDQLRLWKKHLGDLVDFRS